jgi:hypothetical protein
MGGLKIGENVSVSPVYWVQETRGGGTHQVPSRYYEQAVIADDPGVR